METKEGWSVPGLQNAIRRYSHPPLQHRSERQQCQVEFRFSPRHWHWHWLELHQTDRARLEAWCCKSESLFKWTCKRKTQSRDLSKFSRQAWVRNVEILATPTQWQWRWPLEYMVNLHSSTSAVTTPLLCNVKSIWNESWNSVSVGFWMATLVTFMPIDCTNDCAVSGENKSETWAAAYISTRKRKSKWCDILLRIFNLPVSRTKREIKFVQIVSPIRARVMLKNALNEMNGKLPGHMRSHIIKFENHTVCKCCSKNSEQIEIDSHNVISSSLRHVNVLIYHLNSLCFARRSIEL